MSGYYQSCNCCGHEFGGPYGARQYLDHCATQTYYGVRWSPEATFALSAKAREFLGGPITIVEWVALYYKDWTPKGPEVMPVAYGLVSFQGTAKAPEYEAWRREHGIVGAYEPDAR